MKKALIITVVVLVALLGGCAGCIALAYRTFTQTTAQLEPIADEFIARWNARDVDGLYALCGSHGERDAFAARATAAIDAAGTLSQRTMQGINANAASSGTAVVVAYHVHGERRDGVLRLSFARHGEQWALTDFSLETNDAPPAAKPARDTV